MTVISASGSLATREDSAVISAFSTPRTLDDSVFSVFRTPLGTREDPVISISCATGTVASPVVLKVIGPCSSSSSLPLLSTVVTAGPPGAAGAAGAAGVC